MAGESVTRSEMVTVLSTAASLSLWVMSDPRGSTLGFAAGLNDRVAVVQRSGKVTVKM
jgi:hypothetical protein